MINVTINILAMTKIFIPNLLKDSYFDVININFIEGENI